MKKQFCFIFVVLITILNSCDSDVELEKSVFVPDNQYAGLPQYSEWGYNTFGAYYDREAFISTNQLVPIKIIVTNDTTNFIFQGQKGTYNSYEYGYHGSGMTMKLSLTKYLPAEFDDLTDLNDVLINLNNTDHKITFTIGNETVNTEILNGTFHFIKAQRLFVDNDFNQVILSGVFNFQALINGEPIAISHGRFDVGVGENNFFNY